MSETRVTKAQLASGVALQSEVEHEIVVTDVPPAVVTPAIAAAPPLVLLDRELSTARSPDPTPVKLSVSPAAPGKLTCAPASRVDLFEDAACATAFSSAGTISADKLSSGLTLYLRGKSEGKVTLTLTAEGAPEAATKELAVVSVGLDLYQYNQAREPKRVKLDDDDRVGSGGVVHVQSSSGDHGRARVVVKKIDTTTWPAGSESCSLVLDSKNNSGALALYGSETGGEALSLPHKLARASLASDQTFWVEGTSACKASGDATLHLGLQGAGAPLGFGDWACFTVIAVVKVAPGGQLDSPSEAYGSGKYRSYINLKKDPNGRLIEIEAQLGEKIAGIPLHFMLLPHSGNGEALPASWKLHADLLHRDRSSSADALHFMAKTDASGRASRKVRLSRVGGDVFWAGVYTTQDMHLKDHLHGDTAAKKRKPTLSQKITVWRKLWYELRCLEGRKPKPYTAAHEMYRKLFIELVASGPHTFTEKQLPAGTVYPEWMVIVRDPTVPASQRKLLVCGDHNSQFFFDLTPEDTKQPLKLYVVLCDWFLDPAADVTATRVMAKQTSPNFATETVEEDQLATVLKPPLQGGKLVVSGSWSTLPGAPVSGSGSLTDDNVIIDEDRGFTDQIKVKLPDEAAKLLAAGKIKVELRLKSAASDTLGLTRGRDIINKYYPNFPVINNDVMAHEIGHKINQAVMPGTQHASLRCWTGSRITPRGISAKG